MNRHSQKFIFSLLLARKNKKDSGTKNKCEKTTIYCY